MEISLNLRQLILGAAAVSLVILLALIGHAVTETPGSSEYFVGGAIVYSNTAKQEVLGVDAGTLAALGAVSAPVAAQMAQGARRLYGADVAVAVTGIAGPGGGSDDKPVGTVWIAWKRRGGYAKAEVFHFDGDRDAVRRQTVASALTGLEQHLE